MRLQGLLQADREVQPLGTALQPAEAPEQPLLPAAPQLADSQQPGSPGSQAEQLQAPKADGALLIHQHQPVVEGAAPHHSLTCMVGRADKLTDHTCWCT